MRFPLPGGLFPPIRVAEDDAFALRQLAAVFVRDTVGQFDHFRADRGGVVDYAQWRFVSQRRGLSAYADRTLADVAATARAQVAAASSGLNTPPVDSPMVGDMTMLSTKLHAVMVVGTVEGNLHDLMYGLHHSSTRELQLIKSSYTGDKIVDSKILAEIDQPTAEEPLQGLHLKWSVSEIAPFAARLMRKVMRPRDFVYLEAIGFITTPDGERIGYNVLHSLQIPGVRELSEFHIVRANFSICSVFRQTAPQTIEVFMKGFVDAVGNIPSSLAILGSAKALLSYRRGVYCGQMKKLNWLLKAGKRPREDRPRTVGSDGSKSSVACQACGRRQSLSKIKTCQVCTAFVCGPCAVTHQLSFLSRSGSRTKVIQRPTIFCPACIETAMATDAVEVATDEINQRHDPREMYEYSSAYGTRSQLRALSPSNSVPPDSVSEFFG